MPSFRGLRLPSAPAGLTGRVAGCLPLLLAAIACSSAKEAGPVSDTPLDWGPNAAVLPSLRTVLEAEPPAPVLVMLLSNLAIGNDGSVLLITDKSEPGLLAVVDTTGRLVTIFGKRGEGPGELRGRTPVGMTSDDIVVFDMSQMKLTLFDTSGTFVRSVRPKGTTLVVPRSIIDDSTALVVAPGPRASLPGVMDLESGRVTTPIAVFDSFLESFAGPNGNLDYTHPATIGRWLGGLVLADGKNYALAFYDWDGHRLKVITHTTDRPQMTERRVDDELDALVRDGVRKQFSSPARKREHDQMMKKELPYFYQTSTPTIDDQGRLWILGQAGDSGYADVFGRDGFLGRLALSCDGFKSSWALTGHWLALICATDNPASTSGGVLKILRIEG